ncbi:GumC domain-containing protein [Flavobacterium tructae]|uniref:Lipopolysaccharide biosynthesis protein n=1 Tax=Flavobacterium tructae TaxID=1114873 RepID=A0A1S1J673_9FLAO|nr:lipopolysaccharide biosynthesis protein [Flavobacterium tructae]OHT44646.1 lipopolysaccharide biosynthesis protein [Flavobacterium tructae]OXB19216.1 lipopolysaccharide biosynthesis protein [Flavobacterium tructae]
MEKNIDNDEVSLKEFIQQIKEWYYYLLSKWKIILLVVTFGAIVGLSYSLIKKTIYTATLSFALEDEKSGSGGLGGALGLASSLGLDLGGGGGSIFAGANLTELFKSRSMVEKTLLSPVTVNGKVISLAEMYIQNNEWKKAWKDKPKLASIKFLPNANRKMFTRIQDSILGVMYEKLSQSGLSVIQKDKKISIININVSSTNEFFAKSFCESLARQVSKFYVDTKSKKAKMNMEVLQKQVDSIRGQLNGSITRVAVANDNTFNLNPALIVRKTPVARSQVDVQANTAILTELVKQSELAKVTLRKETPLIQVIDRPILPLSQERFGKARGILTGGFLAGILIVLILIVKRILNRIGL